MAKPVSYIQAATQTPQSMPARADQVKNNAGGYAFKADNWARLQRFLILGAEQSTYYVSQKEHVYDNIKCVEACIAEDPVRAVSLAAQISFAGRALKNDPAIFVLASAVCVCREIPVEFFKQMIRTGTHFLTFVSYLDKLGKWNKGNKRLCGNWYGKPLNKLAYQMLKYGNRSGFTQRDALRLVHMKPLDDGYSTLFRWITHRDEFYVLENGEKKILKETGIPMVDAYMRVNAAGVSAKEAVKIIDEFKLTHEMVPGGLKKEAAVWEVLAKDMNPEAMLRNLGNMGACGLLTADNWDLTARIEKVFGDETAIKAARLHPMRILVGMKTYAAGTGYLGDNRWPVVGRVVDCLDGAFYKSFANVEPTEKKIMLAVDVSASMSCAITRSNLSCCEAAGAMALVTANVEPKHVIFGFSDSFRQLPISPKMRLDTVVKVMRDCNFGGTDCALPMLYALRKNADFDIFIVLTDNETWAGNVHPFEALNMYRRRINRDAKLLVQGMISSGFTIADPNDPGMMDVVGFDAGVPQVINDFILGKI